MRAVVMEAKDGHAVVLADNGRFIKIEDKEYVPGMELTLDEEVQVSAGKLHLSKKNMRVFIPCVSAAAALLVAFGIKDFRTPYSYISLDVNPSIEISANRYDCVLGLTAVNEDAAELVETVSSEGYKYRSVENIVNTLLADISEGDYEAEDGNIYVVMSANSRNEEHAEELTDELETIGNSYAEISATAVTADDELTERAREAGTTAGKLYLVDELIEAADDRNLDENEWINKPVKDVVLELNKVESQSTDDTATDSNVKNTDSTFHENSTSEDTAGGGTESGSTGKDEGDRTVGSGNGTTNGNGSGTTDDKDGGSTGPVRGSDGATDGNGSANGGSGAEISGAENGDPGPGDKGNGNGSGNGETIGDNGNGNPGVAGTGNGGSGTVTTGSENGDNGVGDTGNGAGNGTADGNENGNAGAGGGDGTTGGSGNGTTGANGIGNGGSGTDGSGNGTGAIGNGNGDSAPDDKGNGTGSGNGAAGDNGGGSAGTADGGKGGSVGTTSESGNGYPAPGDTENGAGVGNDQGMKAPEAQ